jgi:hypothetical protein
VLRRAEGRQHVPLEARYRATGGRAVTLGTQSCDVVSILDPDLAGRDALGVLDAAEAGQLLITDLSTSYAVPSYLLWWRY